MKITRRQLRDIIIKETRRKRLDQIGKGLNHPFYTNDYDPAGKPVGFDYNSPNVDQNRDDVLDADELRDIADSLDGDRHSTSGNGPRDIVHARLGEVYKENAMEADLSIWLEEHPEFKLVAPGTEFSGWWGTDIIDEESWYVDGPEEGPVNESRIVGGKMKITHRKLRQIIKEELSRITEAASPCNVSEWEATVLFDRGEAEIIATSLPAADLICLMTAGMESDRNFIRIKAGTSGSGSDTSNQDVMMSRIRSAQDEVAGYLAGIAGSTGLPYAWPTVWNKADYDLDYDTIEPGSVLKGTQVPSDPDDPWFRDKQYVKITISAASSTPEFTVLANRFLKATVDRLAPGTDETEVYEVLKSLRDAKDFYQFNQALIKLHNSGQNFYQIACSRGWNKRPLTLSLGSLTKRTSLFKGGPTEIEEDNPTVDAELRRLGVPQLKC